MTERILIIDDHPLTRDALAGLLTQNGFDVVGQAESGEEAIEQARELRPNLMLLDLSMPGMDGLTALPKLHDAAPQAEIVSSRPRRTRPISWLRSAPGRLGIS